MFKEPFSFEGRIRRLEYGIGTIIHVVATYAIIFFAFIAGSGHGVSGIIFLGVLGLIPCFWFAIALNTKRCHDRGNSGWFQLIPYYGLFLLFGPGEVGENRFGEDPKGDREI